MKQNSANTGGHFFFGGGTFGCQLMHKVLHVYR
jgi:hypothetical protein